MEAPDVIKIEVTQFPIGNLSQMSVTIPGRDPYREVFKSHPDNLMEASAKLLRRVANDFAQCLVRSSTTYEAPEVPLEERARKIAEGINWEIESKAERDKLRAELEVAYSEIEFKEELAAEATQREQRRDDLLRSSLRVLSDLL